MKTALIDADTLIYEAALSSEKPIDWGDDLWTLHAHLNEALARFDGLVKDIQTATDADRIVMALTDSGPRWRNEVMPTYKASRKKTRRPVVFVPLREYCHEQYETFQRPGLEGDDVLGILMTHPDLIAGDKVCVSIDKDLKTIPGAHYNYGRLEHFTVDESTSDYWHMMQALMGDTTDGYSGCPKYGKVTAEKLLIEFYDSELGTFNGVEAWKAIVKAYAKAGLSEEVALQNARVARICRHTDYNYDTRSVILWNP